MRKILEIKEVTKKIKGNTVLNNISFSVNSGEIIGIKGRNGSGKSMLFKAIVGLVTIDSGEIIIDGNSNKKNNTADVGFLIEYPGFLPNKSGFTNLHYISSIRKIANKEKIHEIMIQVGLDPNNHLQYKKYSVGMRQKLGIAAAIMESPKLLILDEPFNNLDYESMLAMRELIKKINEENGTTILIASHDLNDYKELCNFVYEIKKGELVNL